MNKEEVKDLITDMWKDELSKSGKWALEEYVKDLQSQLDIANKKIDKIKEIIEDYEVFNGIEYVLDPNRALKTKDILSIIGGD